MNEKDLPFLDILIIKENVAAKADLYFKNTNTHSYLDLRFCYISYAKRSITFNMERRVYSIITHIVSRDWKNLIYFLRNKNNKPS